MRRLPLALAAAFVLAGVTAPGASAVQYCVQFMDPVCEDNSNVTLQDALDDAAATTADDVIHIGAVTISEDPGGPMGNGFHYTSTAGAGNDVALIGQGADETTIQRSDDREFGTFTTSINSHVTFQDLGIFVVGNTAFDDAAFNGLRVREGGATLTRVRVTAEFDAFQHSFNSGVRLVLASGPLTMTDSTIDGAGNQNAECLTSTAFETPVVTGTEFVDCAFGVRAVASSNPSIDRSTFTDGGTGAQVEDGASIEINRSRFLGDTQSLFALNFSADGEFRIDNSLIVREGDSGAIRVAPVGGPTGNVSSGVVNQSTLIGTSDASPDTSVGMSVSAELGEDADVAVHDTIIFGFEQVSIAGFGGTMTSDYSFYDFGTENHTGGTGDIDSEGDTVDPGFVNPPNDFSLASASILRDRDPTPLRPFEPDTTDLAGLTRISNGARDIGAYEFQFVPPQQPPVVTPFTPTPTAAPTPTPTAKKKCKKKKKKKSKGAAAAAKKCKKK